MLYMKKNEKRNDIFAIPHRIHARLTCSMACTWVTRHLIQMKKKLGYTCDRHT